MCVLTVREMADELQIGMTTAWKLVHSDGFPSFRIGKKVLVNKALLEEWARKQCEQKV